MKIKTKNKLFFWGGLIYTAFWFATVISIPSQNIALSYSLLCVSLLGGAVILWRTFSGATSEMRNGGHERDDEN